MRKNLKKAMAGTLGVCMLATGVSGVGELGELLHKSNVVYAATTENIVSGVCGENASWKYDTATKTLTIDGIGRILNNYNFKLHKEEIEKIVIGSQITALGKKIFANYAALKEVEGGDNVNTISNKAFFKCENLKSINIGKNVKTIGTGAFAGCDGLKKIKVHAKNKYFKVKNNNLLNKKGTKWIVGCFVTNATHQIDANIKKVDLVSIENASNIKKISVSSKNKTYSSNDGLLYSKDGKVLYACPRAKEGTVTVRKETTTIGATNVGVFKGCAKVKKIIIDKNVKKMCLNFEGCEQLTDIEIAKANKTYASAKGSILSKDGKELLCCVATNQGTYKIPEGVTKVSERAFLRSLNDLNFSINDSGIIIEHLILPDSLETFTYWASGWDYNIKACLKEKSKYLKSITFGEKYCEDKDKNGNPFLLEEMEQGELEAVYVSEKNPYYSSVDGILYNKEQTKLLFCPKKTKICKMPNTVTDIDENAFYDDKEENGLEQLFVSDAIENIAGHQWVIGWNLKTLHIGKNVKNVNVNMYAKGLEQITVSPENQNYKAEDNVLYTKDGSKLLYCPKAKSGKVTICTGTSIIGEASLLLCKNVTEIVIPDTVTTVEKNAFYVNDKAVFWVPAGKKVFYEELLKPDTGFGKEMSIKEM